MDSNHTRVFSGTSVFALILMLICIVLLCDSLAVDALGATEMAVTSEPGRYYTITAVTLSDGTIIERNNINGPPAPPPGFEIERQAVSLIERDSAAGINILTVPAFNWVFGCSAVSGAMIAGYYDRVGWPNMYTGPTNGGVIPLDNSYWPTWSDGFATYPNCPLIASKNGVDDRVTRGSIDEYWVKYNSSATDPYITNGWTQHTWGDAIGDYMYTSQSAFGNVDGSTTFYNWTSLSIPLSCDFMASNALYDGTLGRKLFYEARGYTITDCYNQKTDNTIAGGFSFAQFKTEIDAGRPVMLNLAGHTVVGVGYDDSSNLVYINDTWDYDNHTMTWGGSYSGMVLQSVSIVNIQGTVIPAPILTAEPAVTPGTENTIYWSDVSGGDENNSFEYYAECADNAGFSSPSNSGWTTETSTTFQNLMPGQTYWYRVKAKSGTTESGWSNIEYSQQECTDTTPNVFTFTDQTGVALNTVATSNTITVSGICAPASISISDGTYSINGGLYTSSSGTVSNGNTVTVQQTSSGSYSTTTNATLTIGGVSDTFSVTTDTGPSLTWTPIPGLTASPPALAWNPSANKLQMVVRAADDSIWTSTFNSSGVFNNDWINIPGLMADTPALAWNTVANKLHLVVRAFDDSIWTSTFNSSGVFNNDWAPISGLTASPPAITWNPVANEIQMVVRGSDDTMWGGTFNSSGVFNNDWANIPGLTASPPAITWNPVANEIQMVVRASDDTMWGSTFSSNGVFNNDWLNIPGQTVSPSALVWDGFESEIAMMVRAFDNSMWYSTFSSAGVFNNDWINFPGMTVSTPAMVYLPSIGYLEIVVRAADNSMWAILY
jgi:hypothetical protein